MDWTNIVTQPLGLAAFALALVFGVAGVKLQDRQRPWFLPAAIILAAIVLIGCLYLAHRQIVAEKITGQPQAPTTPAQVIQQPAQPPSTPEERRDQSPPKPSAPITVLQETHGPGSSAVQGVQGDVTIDHR